MCRLFGMSGGDEPVAATFWLLRAPDSLERQSHREPDGTGLGVFDDDGRAHVHRSARPAFRDEAFRREARTARSRTFIAHIRFASTGAVERRNTHPFEQDGRLLAHNGVIEDLDRLDASAAARLVATIPDAADLPGPADGAGRIRHWHGRKVGPGDPIRRA